MGHRLSVLVQVDLHGRYVRLVVTGCVTEANQHALYRLIRRARRLIPPVCVEVDLSTAEHVEDIAVDLLRWAVDHDELTPEVAGPVRLSTPTALSGHRPMREPHHRQPARWAAAWAAPAARLKLRPR